MKKIYIDPTAEKELRKFSEGVQKKFEGYFDILRNNGKLEFPDAKKIDRYLFEIRVKFDGVYRGFYAYISDNVIVVLHFFRKKSQKTPVKNLRTAEGRLK